VVFACDPKRTSAVHFRLGSPAGSAYYFFIIIIVRHETTAAARRALLLIVRTLFNDAVAVALWTGFHVCLPCGYLREPNTPIQGETPIAVLLALSSTFGFGAAFVLTQVALRWMPPWLGAAVSVPTSTLLFWCLAPLLVDITKADVQAAVLFMCVGLLFPATVTLLNFESNSLMGPNIAGAISAPRARHLAWPTSNQQVAAYRTHFDGKPPVIHHDDRALKRVGCNLTFPRFVGTKRRDVCARTELSSLMRMTR
jgi:hypothetical protein